MMESRPGAGDTVHDPELEPNISKYTNSLVLLIVTSPDSVSQTTSSAVAVCWAVARVVVPLLHINRAPIDVPGAGNVPDMNALMKYVPVASNVMFTPPEVLGMVAKLLTIGDPPVFKTNEPFPLTKAVVVAGMANVADAGTLPGNPNVPTNPWVP